MPKEKNVIVDELSFLSPSLQSMLLKIYWCRVISTKSYRKFDDNMDTIVYKGYLRGYFIAVECFWGTF